MRPRIIPIRRTWNHQTINDVRLNKAQLKEGPKMTDIVRGAAIKGMTRPSKRFNQGRVCAKKGCTTKLSQYNKAEYCHAHAPVRFPRVRGKIMDGQDA